MVCMLSKMSGALGHRASMVLKRVRRDQLDTASFVFSVIKAQEFINLLCLYYYLRYLGHRDRIYGDLKAS